MRAATAHFECLLTICGAVPGSIGACPEYTFGLAPHHRETKVLGHLAPNGAVTQLESVEAASRMASAGSLGFGLRRSLQILH
jgi:hypothetical protein